MPPQFSALFPTDTKQSALQLSKRLRSFATKSFEQMLVFFKRTDLVNQPLVLDIAKLMDLVADKQGATVRQSKDYTFQGNQCAHCAELGGNASGVSMAQKLANKYASCAMVFGVQAENADASNDDGQVSQPTLFVSSKSNYHIIYH